MRRAAFLVVAWVACGGQAEPTARAPTTTSATAAPSAVPSASAAPSAAAAPDAGPPVAALSPACAALAQARAAENTLLKELSDSKDPLKRSMVLEDSERAVFASCNSTKSGGAWGVGLADLKAEGNGSTAQLVAIHADAKGAKTQFVIKGPNDRLKERAFAVNDHDHTAIESLRMFDYDGDGEEELVIVAHDQTHEGPRDPMGSVITFKNGATLSYPPLKDLTFWRVEDNDKDGRLDLVTYGPYRSRIGARCNGAVAIAQGPALLVHAAPDGSFSTSDATAIAFDKQHCDKPGFSVSRDDEQHVDDEQTFVNLACARMWGMTDAQASGLIGSSCQQLTGEATCSDASLTKCVYANVLRQWSKAAPPVTLH